MVPMTYVRAIARAGGAAAAARADARRPRRPVRAARPARRRADHRRRRPRPRRVRRSAPRESERHLAERDAFELALVRAAGERDLPCLGICRGMQVVNVAYGGELEQHLPDRLADDIHRGADGAFADHGVEVEPGSLAALAAGATRVAVKSYHHQGVARVGDGLRVTARAETDGTVEAVEDAERRFMLGVLWHPEEDEADRLIAAFVQECRAAAGDKSSELSWNAGGPDRSGATGFGLEGRVTGSAGEARRDAWRAQRRNVSGRRRAWVPLAAVNWIRATTLWRPKPRRLGRTLIE